MSLEAAEQWIQKVEDRLDRSNEVMIYSGNRLKECLGDKQSKFWAAHRLWLAQYSSEPQVPAAWSNSGYWLWQFTDGEYGPSPHTVAGVTGDCDVNVFDGNEEQLIAEWASGTMQPAPPDIIATVTVIAPVGVKVIVQQ
jgi:lysozyme